MRLGTRGSALALAQARTVAARITALARTDVELVTIRTSGDRDTHASLATSGDIGFFTKEIEQELLAGRIDVAVHSFKDLPVAMTNGLALAAVPEREDPADVLVARDALTLATLPQGARVATSSPRRRAQLLAARRDLEIVEIRGNVETRLGRLDGGAFDALVLARAGLARLGLAARATERLSPEPLVPAPGQGALAVQVRADDATTLAAVAPIDDARARAETAAERAFLEVLGGGCRVPIGAAARQSGDRLSLLGWISDPDAVTILRDEMQGDAARPSELGRRLASHLLERGASHVLGGASRGRA